MSSTDITPPPSTSISPTPTSWEVTSLAKQASLLSKIPRAWHLPRNSNYSSPIRDLPACSSHILTPREFELTENYDATSLVEMMSTGKLKSEELVTAFCKRAAVAHQLVNCLTEVCFEEAIERARQCDKFYEREERGMGALHGLPVSLKDSFNLVGLPTTLGYISFAKNPPSTTNSHLITLLLAQGAIFYCKTNLPQTMMTADSHNNLFGRTLNPHNTTLTAGGSTGGEAALLALRGSVLGLTTDVAGSTRIPALCCGVKSFKPTAGRVPFGGGVPPGRLGSPSSIVPVIGPAGRSVRDFELFFKTVMDSQPWTFDENVLAVPWRRGKPVVGVLRFGLIRGHPKRPLHPSVARILHMAAEGLESLGHTVVGLDEKVPDLYECGILAWKYFLLDPKKTPARIVKDGGEPWVPSIAQSTFPELEGWEASLDELFDMNVERAKVVKRYHDIFVEEKLDAVLMPGYQATAVPHDTYGVPIYTSLQNLINYPAGILPFLKAEKQLDEKYFDPRTDYEPPYLPDAVEGAPGAIQIMGKPMQDEELIKIMEVVEAILKLHT